MSTGALLTRKSKHCEMKILLHRNKFSGYCGIQKNIYIFANETLTLN